MWWQLGDGGGVMAAGRQRTGRGTVLRHPVATPLVTLTPTFVLAPPSPPTSSSPSPIPAASQPPRRKRVSPRDATEEALGER